MLEHGPAHARVELQDEAGVGRDGFEVERDRTRALHVRDGNATCAVDVERRQRELDRGASASLGVRTAASLAAIATAAS